MVLKYFLCLFVMILVTSSTQFCQSSIDKIPLYFQQNEIQQLSLSKYIKGYNLQFQTSSPQHISVFQPYHISAQSKTGFPEDFKLLSAAVRKSNYYLWDNTGIIAAINQEEKQLALKYGKIKGNSIPEFSDVFYFDLDKKVHCYSALIINQNLDVAIDCVSYEQNIAYVCIANRQSHKTTCSEFDNIVDIDENNQKVSEIMNIGQQTFLVSGFISKQGSSFKNQTFITIYNLNSGKPQFNLIIDKRMLNLNSLSLTDLIITQKNKISYIQITDPVNGIIKFIYQKQNSISDIETIKVQGVPYHIQNANNGNILIGVQKGILQYSRDYIFIRKYNLEEKDIVVEVQASSHNLAILTKGNKLLTFKRSQTQYRYLLSRINVDQNTGILLSPYYHNLVQINLQEMKLVQITSGYIIIGKVEDDFEATISANSQGLICKTTFGIKLLDDSQIDNIFQKKNFSSHGFQSKSQQQFYLSDYFGGKNLQYKYALSNIQNISSSSITLEHVKQRDFKNPQELSSDALYQVVQIDSKNFFQAYYTNNKIYAKSCSICQKCGRIMCDLTYSETVSSDVVNIDGKKTAKGQYYLSWTYQKYIVEILNLQNPNKKITKTLPNDYQISSVVVGDQLIFYVQKMQNTFHIFSQGELYTIDDTSFTDEQLEQLQGFYPRQIILNPTDPYVFYGKFPSKFVTMAFVNGKVEILSIRKISDTYIPDNQWSVIVGHHTLMTFYKDVAYQFSLLSNQTAIFLHAIPIEGGMVLPPQYSPKTDTAVIQTKDNNLQYIRLNRARYQSLYYQMFLTKPMWVISDSWLIIPQNTAYYQWKQPILSVSLEVEQQNDFGDATLQVVATKHGETEGIKVRSQLGALRYPVSINQNGQNLQPISLPQVGNQTIIPFNISSAFKGSIAKAQILCPFTIYDKILLRTPFSDPIINAVTNNIKSIVTYKNVSIALAQSSLNILNKTNCLVKSIPIPTTKLCQKIAIASNELIVYCLSDIVKFTVSQKDITLVGSYIIPSQIYIQNIQDLQIYPMQNQQTIIAIHDNNPLDTSDNKKSDIKLLILKDNIQLLSIVNAQTFNLPFQVSINSMSLQNNHMLVTLGNKGLGYLQLKQKIGKGTFIDITKQQKIGRQMTDNTKFLRVVIIASALNSWQILVTTSNSFNYVLSVHLNNKVFSFVIQQTYNKYGTLQTLNWAQVTPQYVMLSFYQQSTQNQSIAIYHRSTHGLNSFFATKIWNQRLSKLPITSLIKNNKFYNFYQAQKYGLTQYNLTGSYAFYLDYQKPGNFEKIGITLSNSFTTFNGSIDVQFDIDSSDGLKWWAVVIIVALVLIVVGVAFGMFLKMKARKDDKNQSLVTQTQEIDEEI